MTPPSVAGPARTEVGSAAVMGGGNHRVVPSAAAATAGSARGCCPGAAAPPRPQPTVADEAAVLLGWEERGSGCCSGVAAPPRPYPTVADEAAILQGWEDRRPAGGSSSPPPPPSEEEEEPLTPEDQLAVANELIYRFGMAQEMRTLSDDELCLVKLLLAKIPVLEAVVAASGGHHSPRWGFRVAAPVRLAWLCRRSLGPQAPPPRSPSSLSQEALTPAQIAKEVIGRLNSLVKFLEDRMPDLEAASGVCRGAAQSLSKLAFSGRGRSLAKASCAVAASLTPVSTLRHPKKVATPAATHVTVGPQVVTRRSGEEDAHAASGVHNNISEANASHENHRGQVLSSEHESSSSSSSKEPLSPGLQLEVAKQLILGFTRAQQTRMLAAHELSFMKSLEDRIPDLEAASGVCGGAAPSSSKEAPSGHAHEPAKASRVAAARALIMDILSRRVEVATPAAAHVTVGPQFVNRHSGEEDANVTSGVHNNNESEANVSGVCARTTLSSIKVAPSGHACAPAKAGLAVSTSLSPVSTTLHPGKVDTPAVAHIRVAPQVVTRHLGEETAHATSGVHNKMPDANASHGHHRGRGLLSEHEYFSERCNNVCDLGTVTKKSSSTISPEMVPGPSYGDYTAESSGACVSHHWGIAPEATDIDDFRLPDDLGIY